MILYGHPFSSYTWKAAIALDEKGLAYDFRQLGPDQPEHQAELAALWPLANLLLLAPQRRAPDPDLNRPL